MNKILPPIALFGHKRPEHLKAAIEAIEASQKLLNQRLPLYIFCDAAGKPEHEKGVKETLDVARRCSAATVVAREKNMGFRNITEGISQLCNTFGRAIIVEDDVLISPDFLPFMCAALEKYESDPRVTMASGFMYYGSQPARPETFFLPTPFIWGWATWKRAWDLFDWECQGWEQLVKSKQECYRFDCLGSIPFSKGLRKTLTGEWKAWGPRWLYAMHKANGLCLYPYQSLVWNCGCGGGTHGDAKRDLNPELTKREFYIHGTMQRSDFLKPRLPENYTFPKVVQENKRGMRTLAITFLQERLRKEHRKRWRLYLKLARHKALHFLDKCRG